MFDGFFRVAVGTPKLQVADCAGNVDSVKRIMKLACQAGAKVLVLPELCITAYTCGDLFFQDALQIGALNALKSAVQASKSSDMLTFVGVPLAVGTGLYDCAVAIQGGKILGVCPKQNIDNYPPAMERRYFTPGKKTPRQISLLDSTVPFGANLLFVCEEMPDVRIGVEFGSDLFHPCPPSVSHALAGATVIANLSADAEYAGRADRRKLMMRAQSANLLCAYLFANAGVGESTTDLVYGGRDMILENGKILASTKRYDVGFVTTDIDIAYLAGQRRAIEAFAQSDEAYTLIPFHVKMESLTLDRFVDPSPFVPADALTREKRWKEILDIQVNALIKRLEHVGVKTVLLGLSGGLDSTLALIVCARAFETLGYAPDGVVAVTMPCFGTTDRTYQNAVKLADGFNAKLMEIDIKQSVEIHLKDIGQPEGVHDVTYENAQARERTQVLMDLGNRLGGLVVGTGDLSELALGWATYNGDHMSMYGVNAGVPKTLVRHLVGYAAQQAGQGALGDALRDVLDTPVSPELLPPTNGVISQSTEEIVGPYELHDFFLYHIVRRKESPQKVNRLAKIAFDDVYSASEIEKWLMVFIKRFFAQQFKRSCLPDGPKVGSVGFSPRGDFSMPSDVNGQLWRKILENDA